MSYSNPYQSGYGGFSDREPGSLKHSGLGVASLVLGLAVGLLEFICIVIAGVLQASTPGGVDENSPVAIATGLVIIGGMFLGLCGIGLGVAGLFQQRKKLFAVLGVVVGSLVMLCMGGLFVLGMMMS